MKRRLMKGDRERKSSQVMKTGRRIKISVTKNQTISQEVLSTYRLGRGLRGGGLCVWAVGVSLMEEGVRRQERAMGVVRWDDDEVVGVVRWEAVGVVRWDAVGVVRCEAVGVVR